MLFKKYFNAISVLGQYLRTVFKDDPKYAFLSIITTIINNLFPIVNIILPKFVIDSISKVEISRVVVLIIILLISNLAIRLFNSIISSQYLTVLGTMSSMRFLTNISRKTSELDLSQIECKEIRDNIDMAKNVIYRGIHQDVIQSSAKFITSIIMMITTIAILINSSFFVFVAILITCLICSWISFKIESDNVSIQVSNQEAMTKMGYFTDTLEGRRFSKEIRLYHLGKWIEKKCFEISDVIRNNLTASNKKWSVARCLQMTLSTFLDYGSYMFFAMMALLRKISIGDFTMYFQSVSSFKSSFESFLSFFSKILINAEYIAAYNQFMNLKSTIVSGENKIELNDKGKYNLSLKNVSFKYDISTDYILKNINLDFQHGKTYVIVGENGSGKTTLLNIICRFYDPQEGTVFLNDEDIKSLNIVEYHSLYSAIFQGFDNLSLKIRENISLNQDFVEGKASYYIENMGMKKVIDNFQDGYDTYLNKNIYESGVILSGGQNQRLSLTRAFYRESPFLILDEPTSALDPVAENALINLIKENANNKTIFIVSHRLSSVSLADKVIYIDNGEIDGFDTHQKLYNKNKKYMEFYDAQAEHYR